MKHGVEMRGGAIFGATLFIPPGEGIKAMAALGVPFITLTGDAELDNQLRLGTATKRQP